MPDDNNEPFTLMTDEGFLLVVENNHTRPATAFEERLLNRCVAAEQALVDAIDFAEEGWGYAPEYFRTKWAYDDRLNALLALAAGPAMRLTSQAVTEPVKSTSGAAGPAVTEDTE